MQKDNPLTIAAGVATAIDISAASANQLAGRHPHINVRFPDRHLFPMIRNGFKPGALLIFESLFSIFVKKRL
jgi:hypothetical protein